MASTICVQHLEKIMALFKCFLYGSFYISSLAFHKSRPGVKFYVFFFFLLDLMLKKSRREESNVFTSCVILKNRYIESDFFFWPSYNRSVNLLKIIIEPLRDIFWSSIMIQGFWYMSDEDGAHKTQLLSQCVLCLTCFYSLGELMYLYR